MRGGTKPLLTPLEKDIQWPVQFAPETPKAALSTWKVKIHWEPNSGV